jgi:toxin FitB
MILDTNVISELMRPEPEASVVEWVASQQVLYVTAITRAELLLGVALLPPGKRRTRLTAVLHELFESYFAARCLSFDSAAADVFANIRAQRSRRGEPISTEDAQIAAIAGSQGLALVTRNVRDFAGIDGLELINPWS